VASGIAAVALLAPNAVSPTKALRRNWRRVIGADMKFDLMTVRLRAAPIRRLNGAVEVLE
jgi:hypothetical protein